MQLGALRAEIECYVRLAMRHVLCIRVRRVAVGGDVVEGAAKLRQLSNQVVGLISVVTVAVTTGAYALGWFG